MPSCKFFQQVIHLSITCRLDFWNSLYYGLDQSSVKHLQLVQNASARLLTTIKRTEHITLVLESLASCFKFAFNCPHSLAPSYLSGRLVTHIPARTTRSSLQMLLVVPRPKCNCHGDRAFSLASPKLWNSLPFNFRSAQSLKISKNLLKTYL